MLLRCFQHLSVGEVEVVISVIVIFSLTSESSNGVQYGWDEGHSSPDSDTEVNNKSLNEEFASSSVQEVEEPLLIGV